MTMTIYDDAEGMLKDQGLEVVVIPYCPSPPPPPTRRLNSLHAGQRGSQPQSTLRIANRSSLSPNQPLIVTPRSQLAMVEAICHQENDLRVATSSPQRINSDRNRDTLPPLSNNDSIVYQRSHSAPTKRTIQTILPTTEKEKSILQKQPQQQLHQYHRSKTTGTTAFAPSKSKLRKSSSSSSFDKLKLSYLQIARIAYQQIVHAIIRPPRSSYPLEALGPDIFHFCNAKIRRRDFSVVNDRGMRIECSLWRRVGEEEHDKSEDDWGLGEERLGEKSKKEVDDQCDETNLMRNLDVTDDDCVYAGKVVLDDWDEHDERGKMFFQLPQASTTSEETLEAKSLSSWDEGQTMKKYGSNDSTLVKSSRNASNATPKFVRSCRRYPVVIYLHGNSSSRIEVIPQLGHLLSLGVAILAFDFAGSGRSEGEFVSLGYFEREDLRTVIQRLRASERVSSIALWGRSMGAATALMYGSQDPTISCMILDSPFTDLTRLSEEIFEKGKNHGMSAPNFVLSIVMRMLRSSVKAQAGFSIRHLSPISHAHQCFIPAMFYAGEHDDFIDKRHSILIHEKYAGDKNIVIFDGDHSSPRPRYILQSACLFLQSCMRIPACAELIVSPSVNLMLPPWMTLPKAQAKSFVVDRSWLPMDNPHQERSMNNSVSIEDNSQIFSTLRRLEQIPPMLPLARVTSAETGTNHLSKG